MNELACVIVDYKRPQNMEQIIASVKKQDISCDIYVIHNGNKRRYDVYENINLEKNYGPGIRHRLLPIIENPFVVFIDDDLELVEPSIFGVMLEYAKKFDTLVGTYGVVLGDNEKKPYSSGDRIYHTDSPVRVDIILGLFHMTRTRLAEQLFFSNLSKVHKVNKEIIWEVAGKKIYDQDDIILSSFFQEKYVVGTGEKPYRELDLAGGLEFNNSHLLLRNLVSRRLFCEI